MNEHKILTELGDIHFRYERLTSLIGLLQQITDEMVEVAGIPQNSLSNALYEIELDMDENNNRLKKLMALNKQSVA